MLDLTSQKEKEKEKKLDVFGFKNSPRFDKITMSLS